MSDITEQVKAVLRVAIREYLEVSGPIADFVEGKFVSNELRSIQDILDEVRGELEEHVDYVKEAIEDQTDHFLQFSHLATYLHEVNTDQRLIPMFIEKCTFARDIADLPTKRIDLI